MEVNGGSGVDKLGCATVFHGLEVVFVRHCGTGKRRGDDFVVGLGISMWILVMAGDFVGR